MNKNIYIIVMAGGIGSRFWPESTPKKPKQFLDILGTGKTLIQNTFDRFSSLCNPENFFVITSDNYISLVEEQLPKMPKKNILGEPCMKNTAPCILYTALKIKKQNPDAILLITPADHLITDQIGCIDSIKKAVDYASKNDSLLTLGMKVSRPDTGYGYIHYDTSNSSEVTPVLKFVEKPNLEKAKHYMSEGDYLWNAGIFIWSLSSILKSFSLYQKKMLEQFEKLYPYLDTHEEKEKLDETYSSCESISIDYAILENAKNVYTIPSNIGWSDLGTWQSVYDISSKDTHGNMIHGEIKCIDGKNNILKSSKGKKIVVQGLSDYIVIDNPQYLLICQKEKEQNIKEYSALVK